MSRRHLEEVAGSYDDDGTGALLEATLARLAWRARRGRKECSACHEDLPVSAFTADSREPDGLYRVCRACRSSRRRARTDWS